MCSNVDCTWPFDCQDMGRCFEHDATVPSMRKRAKKRKALAIKEERRHKRVTPGPIGSVARPTLDVQQPSTQPSLDLLSDDLDWLADLCQQPSAASSTAANTSSGTPLRTAGHNELFLSQGNYQNETLSEASPDARVATPCTLALDNNSYTDWLQSLVSNHGLTSLPPSVECPLLDNNVADLFAAFGSGPNTESSIRAADTSFLSAFTSGDAVIPRTSRHPSPATSNNSESGPDDLAMLIGGNGDISKIFSSQPQSSALDPLSLLLSSPPHSAPVAGNASAVGSIGLLDHYYWSNSQSVAAQSTNALSASLPSSVVPANIGAKHKLPNSTAVPLDHDVPFDLDHLFSSPPATAALTSPSDLSATVQSVTADNLIENILGSSTTGCF
ncbi:hypothetical protein H4S04_004361 [Coemansia sp. S16]|nr:hypothetical protein H4S03_001454 [Coemansia sp. S3946]KAJ2047568.1 hypothetical protein H4S04_004361 [Coemansia sp. S16]KAJ2069289.1 hypothetical protein GGI08_000427 [Coemansia sp. S2]